MARLSGGLPSPPGTARRSPDNVIAGGLVVSYPDHRMKKLSLAALLLFLGCGKLSETPTSPGGGGEPVDPTATFTRVQNEVFTPSCALVGCHDPLGASSGMVLSAGRAYGEIVGKPSVEVASLSRIQPGSPDNSYLYRKIVGTAITGSRMPLVGGPLDDAKIRLVRDWIRRGAPND